MNFNNRTGAVQAGALVPCTDSMPGVNSTEGRMNAIRDAFSKNRKQLPRTRMSMTAAPSLPSASAGRPVSVIRSALSSP